MDNETGKMSRVGESGGKVDLLCIRFTLNLSLFLLLCFLSAFCYNEVYIKWYIKLQTVVCGLTTSWISKMVSVT